MRTRASESISERDGAQQTVDPNPQRADTASAIMALQASAGNQAVANLLSPDAERARQDLVSVLIGAHAAAVDRLTGITDDEVTALAASLADHRNTIDEALQSALGRVTDLGATAATRVADHAARADAALTLATEAAHDRLETGHQGAVTDAGATLSQRRDRTVDAAQARATTATMAADASADHVLADAAEHAAAARQTGAARAEVRVGADADDDAAVRQAQAAAAAELARDTATKITDGTADSAQVLRGQGGQVGAALVDYGSTIVADFGTRLDGFLDDLSRQTAATASAVDDTADGARTALADGRDRVSDGIQDGVRNASGVLKRAAGQRHAESVDAVDTFTAGLRAAVAETVAQSTAALDQATDTISAQPLTAEQAGQLAEPVLQGIDAGVDATAGGGASAQAAALRDAFAAIATDTAAALADTADQSTAELTETAAAAGARLGEIGSRAATSMSSSAEQATVAGDAAVTDFGSALDEHIDAKLPGLDGLLDQHRQSLDAQADQVRGRVGEPANTLDARITSAQERASERARRSWLSNQFHDLVDMITPEFLVGLLVGLAVAALIILTAGAATPFVVMAAAVAAGAAGAAAGTLVGNYRTGQDLTHNLLRNTIYGAAAGAAGAAVYLFGAGVIAGYGAVGLTAAVGGFVVLEVSAVVSTVVGNLLADKPWDTGLLAAMLLAPVIAELGKRLPVPEGEEGQFGRIDPAAPTVGEWTFTENVETVDGTQMVTVEASLPDGTMGFAKRGYNPQTGEFVADQIDLGEIPPKQRFVSVDGTRMHLSDYLTMRIMRILGVAPNTLRNVRISEVENVAAVVELEMAARDQPVSDDNPIVDAAARGNPAVAYNERVLSAAGSGRIIRTHVTRGQRIMLSDLLAKWEGEAPSQAMVARHDRILTDNGLTRDTARTFSVRSGFDIEVTIAPPAPDAQPLVPVLPVTPTDDQDGGQ